MIVGDLKLPRPSTLGPFQILFIPSRRFRRFDRRCNSSDLPRCYDDYRDALRDTFRLSRVAPSLPECSFFFEFSGVCLLEIDEQQNHVSKAAFISTLVIPDFLEAHWQKAISLHIVMIENGNDVNRLQPSRSSVNG